MIRRVIIIILAFVLCLSGQKKEKKASTHYYDADINIYKFQVKDSKVINEKKVASDIIRLYKSSPQKYYYKKLKLSKNLRIVIKADMFELLKINVYREGKLLFEINERKYDDINTNHFYFKFKDKKFTYEIKAETWIGYLGDFGHGSTMGISIYKDKK